MVTATVIAALGGAAQGAGSIMSAGKPAVVVVTSPLDVKQVDAISAFRETGTALREMSAAFSDFGGSTARLMNEFRDTP